MKYALLLVLLALSACTNLHPKTVSDAARDLCITVFSERPEVIRQAKNENISPIDIAKAACAVNDVLNPFLLAGRQAGDEAMGQSQKLGLVK